MVPILPHAANPSHVGLCASNAAAAATACTHACAACHGPNGSGIPNQYARIGGQFPEYTEAQLTAFNSSARANNAVMATIAARMSPSEIKAVADYVGGLR